MKKFFDSLSISFSKYLVDHGVGIKTKMVAVFVCVKIFSLMLVTYFAWNRISNLSATIRSMAIADAAAVLNDQATDGIESLTTDIAQDIASFLYDRDGDIRMLATLHPNEDNFAIFAKKTRRLVRPAEWKLSSDGSSWVRIDADDLDSAPEVRSSSQANDDGGAFRSRAQESYIYDDVPLYDEITFIDLYGNELVKVTSGSTKRRFPMSRELKNVSDRRNTYVRAETYFDELTKLKPGEIYVSDVIGAYVPSNFVGTYTKRSIDQAKDRLGYDIDFDPEAQAYAGKENPNGIRFEGIIRWATPVANENGHKIGYVTLALNHDHIMEFVEHRTPTRERYTPIPDASDGNYAFICDYDCRSIAHPRHHSICGYDPATGEPQVPWLEESIYDAWQSSGVGKWYDFLAQKNWPEFDDQSRSKHPAPELTKNGLVGLDGRWLNNAPQCTGWMELTANGGSGSFLSLWSGKYKLTAAAAIPYYTGRYAPSEKNGWSRRGFGFVVVGADFAQFTRNIYEIDDRISDVISEQMSITKTQLQRSSAVLILFVIVISYLIADWVAKRITTIIDGIGRYRRGEMQFRFEPPVNDEFGKIAHAFDVMADSISDNFQNPVTITDLDLNIIFMNNTALKILGRTLDECIGHKYREMSVYPHDTQYDPIASLDEGFEPSVYHDEAHGLYLRPSAHYTTDEEGRKIGYFIESINVTAMQKMQNEITEAMEEANAANRHKSEFLARMSHEIRTPMNAIIGLTPIIRRMLDAAIPPDHRQEIDAIEDHISKIESSSKHLLGLLNDVLDISKLDTGELELVNETSSMSSMIEYVDSVIAPRCADKKIRYETDVEDFGSQMYRFDASHLRQALINMLGNAVKFTPNGGTVSLSVRKVEDAAASSLFSFTIADTGIGIEESTLETIFEPFSQANDKIARQYGGTGLGLSISRRIVELMGGKIEVASELDRGTTMSFEIWIEKVDEAQADELTLEDLEGKLAGKKILIVDDIEINRMIVATMLEETGVEIDEAKDGSEALEMFERSSADEYSLIIMDIQMPKMDGYEASTRIRSLDRADASMVPIVALSANAFDDDVKRSLESGMNGHMAKPIDEARIVDVLVRYVIKK